LQEEIGLKIEDVHLWREQLVDYPHALVRLNFCKVTRWQGELEMREGQNCAWQDLPVQVFPVLPGTVPVLAWLAEEQGYIGQTHQTQQMPQTHQTAP
jgi:8-oxo-dGTP diphosphatase